MDALTASGLLKIMFERLSREQLSELAVQLGLCLECGGSLIQSNGEVVCAQCGLVWLESDFEDERIPFPEFDDPGDKGETGGHYEMHWNPECSLAFGRNLGSCLTARDVARILRRGGISRSASFMRLRSEAEGAEPAALKSMLTRISTILDKCGLRGNHVAAEYAGRLMRKVYKIARAAGTRLNQSMADTVAAYTLYKLGVKNYDKSSLDLKPRDLAILKAILSFEEELKRIKKTYQQKRMAMFK